MRPSWIGSAALLLVLGLASGQMEVRPRAAAVKAMTAAAAAVCAAPLTAAAPAGINGGRNRI